MHLLRFRIRTLMIAVAIVGLGVGWLVWRIRNPGRPFDPVAWQHDSEGYLGIRQAMADRLLASHSLEGKTRQEVIDMLGEPLNTGLPITWGLTYYLGPERSFISIDSECLVMRLGRDGRVKSAHIHRD